MVVCRPAIFPSLRQLFFCSVAAILLNLRIIFQSRPESRKRGPWPPTYLNGNASFDTHGKEGNGQQFRHYCATWRSVGTPKIWSEKVHLGPSKNDVRKQHFSILRSPWPLSMTQSLELSVLSSALGLPPLPSQFGCHLWTGPQTNSRMSRQAPPRTSSLKCNEATEWGESAGADGRHNFGDSSRIPQKSVPKSADGPCSNDVYEI